jgi:DNA-binding CsgD family transcriptional regulator
LFVRELTFALRDNGRLFRSGGRWVLGPGVDDTIPGSVTGLFEERVGSLDPADRAALEAVSICADVATADIVEAVCPGAADRLDGLCANGFIEAGLVYRVVHPLLAEAVYALMPVRTRQAYHTAAANAVGEVSRRAYHIGRAGSAVDPTLALEALCAAVRHAVVRRAGEEGVQHARSAIAWARRLGRTDLVPGLLVQLAESASCSGRSEEAIQAWRDAADAGDRTSCLLRLAQVETDCGRLVEANEHLEEAARLTAPDAIELRIDIAQVSLVLHTRAGSPTGVLDAVVELERIADPRAQALARYARLELTGYGIGTVAEAEADAVIREVGAVAGVPLIASLELISMGTAVGRGEHAVVRRRVQRSAELVRAAGLPVLEAIPTAFWALAQFQAGAWDSALALADHALVLAHRVDLPRGIALALAVRALVLVHRGEVAEAEACAEEAALYYRERRIARLLELIGAQLALTRGDLERAVELAPAHGPFAVPVLHWQVRAEACRLTGDHKEVSRMIDELDSLGFPYARAVADMVRGGPSLLAEAATALDALALPFDAAVCRLELADALAGIDQQAAIAAATQAMAVFDDLEAVPRASQARRLLRGLGTRPKPRERRSGELSARETEVALLVAQGMANTTIAHQLYISPRTVTTHLERIYRRLGLSSRHDLTRYMTGRNT